MAWNSNVKRMQENEHIVEVKRLDGTVPPLLWDFLRLATAHGLEKFIVNKFPAHIKKLGRFDEKGNFIVDILEKDKPHPETLFSSHMDTVHNVNVKEIPEGQCPIISILKIKDNAPNDMEKHKNFIWGGIKSDDTKKRFEACQLGADDKVGVWLMCEMIDHEIPGRYIFHVGEEKGCIGSRFIATSTPDLLKDIKRAVAFDRMDTTHVIAHQRGDRCSSLKFSEALSKALNENIGLPLAGHFRSDVHGVWTDTAEYMKLVPEVTNLSVGYYDQHTGDERLDVWWLVQKFLPALLKIDWNALPTIRDPKEKPSYQHYHGGYNGDSYDNKIWDHELNRFVSTQEYKAKLIAQTGQQFVAFKDITALTSPQLVPPWGPDNGVPFGVTAEGLKVLCRRWIDKAFPEDRARVLSRALISAETEELEHMIAEERLKRLEKALGKEVFQHLIDTTEVDDEEQVQTVEAEVVPEQKALPKPEEEKKADENGFPFDDKEALERSKQKMAIIATYITHRSSLKLIRQQMSQMDHLVQRHHKFTKEINRQCKDKISKNMYRAINKLLFDATCLVLEAKCDVDAFVNARQAAITYMRANGHEQGFPERIAANG